MLLFYSFWKRVFCETGRWMCYKNKVFWMIPIWHLQILMKIWCRKRDFGRWILRPRLINFDGNPCCFLTIPILTSWDFNEKMMPKTWFREVKFEAQVDQFWGKSKSFFNHFAFWKCLEIEGVHECSELMEKRKWAF